MLDQVLRPAWLDRNLLDLTTMSEISIFASLVVQAELDDALADSQAALTIFAPIDAAFSAASDDLDSGNGPAQLSSTLLYHMVADGPIPSSRFESVSMIQTIEGGSLTFVPLSASTLILGNVNGARVLAVDRAANNGLLHIIDAVLFPV